MIQSSRIGDIGKTNVFYEGLDCISRLIYTRNLGHRKGDNFH